MRTGAAVVDPKDDSPGRFYRDHGFVELQQPERRMFIPIETALRYVRSQGEAAPRTSAPKASQPSEAIISR
jgi:hypothetical protein